MSDASQDQLTTRVPASAAGQPLLAWLAERFRYFDIAGWQQQIAAGRIRHNDAPADATARLVAGDRIAFAVAAPDGPCDLPTIVHEDADLVVVDKPPLYVVQRVGAFGYTFVAALEARCGARLEAVHRLDRETSGLLVLAKTRPAFTALQAQWQTRSVAKTYLALVHGHLASERLTVDAPIGPVPGGRIGPRRTVLAATAPQARAAITHFTVQRRLARGTLVHAVPETGRTHQIRVHLEHLGHPLVGDKLYGRSDDEYLAWVAHVKSGGTATDGLAGPTGRHLLHAASLAFDQPRTGARIAVTAPLPADFARALAVAAVSAATPAAGSDADP